MSDPARRQTGATDRPADPQHHSGRNGLRPGQHARRVERHLVSPDRGRLGGRVEALAREIGAGDPRKRKHRAQDRPVTGTRLIREWQGIEYCVTVRDEGFEYQGRPYESLSAIARAITGTRWNGPLFFGLRSRQGRA